MIDQLHTAMDDDPLHFLPVDSFQRTHAPCGELLKLLAHARELKRNHGECSQVDYAACKRRLVAIIGWEAPASADPKLRTEAAYRDAITLLVNTLGI